MLSISIEVVYVCTPHERRSGEKWFYNLYLHIWNYFVVPISILFSSICVFVFWLLLLLLRESCFLHVQCGNGSHSHRLDKSKWNEANRTNRTIEKERPIKQAHISLETIRIIRIAIHTTDKYSWFFIAIFVAAVAAAAAAFSHYIIFHAVWSLVMFDEDFSIWFFFFAFLM